MGIAARHFNLTPIGSFPAERHCHAQNMADLSVSTGWPSPSGVP
jgi:hypothetical protein